ncbi:immunoglobulin domain-containing family protein [Rheinheimera gaetbuli]
MAKNSKGLGFVLMLGITSALTGCSGNSDELDEKLAHSASITLINSWSAMADLHVAKRKFDNGYSGLFDTDNLVSQDVPVNNVGAPYKYSYKAINNIVNLGVRDSISRNQEERTTKTLSNGEKLWVIAWEDTSGKTLSVVTRKQHSKADTFNVRLFADANYAVSVDGNNVLNTEKGKVTAYLEVNNCANSLKVADKAIDLCTAELGASYLLVVDRNGARVMATE